ncbi:cyclophilin-like fold protein [Priestia megaterium]
MIYKPKIFQKRRLCLLCSWGNIAIFHKGFEKATNDLVILGQIESGKENLENIDNDFTVNIKKYLSESIPTSL